MMKNVIFDFGGVLIDWNPEYVFLKEFRGDRAQMNWFFENICTSDWNEQQDAGYSIEKATQERIRMLPGDGPFRHVCGAQAGAERFGKQVVDL